MLTRKPEWKTPLATVGANERIILKCVIRPPTEEEYNYY
jgi:hypothetical protein